MSLQSKTTTHSFGPQIFYFGILFGYQVLNRMPSVSFNCATSTPKPTNATTTASATTASTTTATTTTTTSTTTTATTTTAAPSKLKLEPVCGWLICHLFRKLLGLSERRFQRAMCTSGLLLLLFHQGPYLRSLINSFIHILPTYRCRWLGRVGKHIVRHLVCRFCGSKAKTSRTWSVHTSLLCQVPK